MIKYDFFETTLRCDRSSEALERMTSTKERALPLTHDLHLLSIEKVSRKSLLLFTAPICFQLHFRNYKITVDSIDVCPIITDYVMKSKGCYGCQILCGITFTALSL